MPTAEKVLLTPQEYLAKERQADFRSSVSHDSPLVERYVCQDDGTWMLKDFRGLEQTLEFASVPAKIPLADIYRGVKFPEATNR
jgi:hypothetical protein